MPIVLPLDPTQWPERHYSVISTDPPWMYYGSGDKDQAAEKHYNLMTLEDLIALPVNRILASNGIVFMWATSPKLDVAIDLIRGWSLHYRGIASVWVKTTNGGKIIHGQGIRPSLVKSTTELLLWASKKPAGRPLPLKTESQEQVVTSLDERFANVNLEEVFSDAVFAPRPGNKHSAKPVIFRTRIEELLGDIPRLEMFYRGVPPEGWHVWGNEIDYPAEEVLPQVSLF